MRRGLATVTVAWMLHSAVALADGPLDAARRDVADSEYLGARTALVAALGNGGASPDELADIFKLTGIVEGATGNDAAARAAFEKWLALDPKGALPVGTSPKIQRPFDAAAKAAREPIKVKVETSASPPSVTVVIASDPTKLIARARVYVVADGAPETKLEAAGTSRIAFELPRGRRLDLRVVALDARGNRVVELGSRDVPIVITGGEPIVVAPRPKVVAKATHATHDAHTSRPLYLRWWLYGGIAIVAGGVGTYFGLEARSATNELSALNANSQAHLFSEAQALEDHAKREALACNITVGIAGAFALGAAVLYLTEPTLEPPVTVAPMRGGAAISWGGSW